MEEAIKRDTKGMEGKDSGLGLEISRRTLLRVLATSAVAVLVRNENYYLPERIFLDGITFFPYPDDTSRTWALRTGSVDIIDYVPWKDMTAIEADKKLALYSDKEGAHGGLRV